MKNTNKNLIKTLLLMPLLALASCGGGNTPSSSAQSSGGAQTSSGSEDVEITFWHTMGKTNQQLLERLITGFNKKYPHIIINHTAAAGDYNDLQQIILQAIPANTTPTMAFCYPDHVAEYLEANAVVDMTPYTTDSKVGFTKEEGSHVDTTSGKEVYGVADYVDAYWQEGCNYTVPGIYSVPFAKSTEALFYNKTAFANNGWTVPTTWDEVWELCKTIRQAYPQKGEDQKYIYTPLGYDSDSNFYITMSEQLEIPFTSITEPHYTFNNADAKAMVADLKDKYDKGYFVTKGTSGNGTYTSTKFTAGEIFMSIGSTGGTTYNQTENFEVGVAVPPSVDVFSPAVISQGPSICFFTDATPEQREAAWLFYKYISSAESSCFYGVSTGYQPVRTSSYETQVFKDFINAPLAERTVFNDVAETSLGMLDSYFNSPVFKGSAKARKEVGGLLSSALIGSDTIEECFNTAYTHCIMG